MLALLLAACALPGRAAPVVKLGVIAPFEGAGRPLGDAVLPVIKSAVAAANADGRLGPYRLAVVAFNDSLDAPTAAAQARALALDADVVAVVGPFTEATTAASRPILASAGLAQTPARADGWSADSLADARAAAAAATAAAVDAVAADIHAAGRPTRDGVLRALAARTLP